MISPERICHHQNDLHTYRSSRIAVRLVRPVALPCLQRAGLDDRGGTEKIIGRWLAQGGGRRDAVIIAAKVFGHCAAFYDRREENSATDGLSKYKILKHCEGTLKRLQTDHLELFQMHHIDHNFSHQEMWEAMYILQKQGKIVYVGSSNYAGWDIAECCMTAKLLNKQPLASEQSRAVPLGFLRHQGSKLEAGGQ